LNPLFRFVETGEEKGRVRGHLEKINDLKNVEKLCRAGKYSTSERGLQSQG
jgi:hypothetical protein